MWNVRYACFITQTITMEETGTKKDEFTWQQRYHSLHVFISQNDSITPSLHPDVRKSFDTSPSRALRTSGHPYSVCVMVRSAVAASALRSAVCESMKPVKPGAGQSKLGQFSAEAVAG